jgi:hypothetical protein
LPQLLFPALIILIYLGGRVEAFTLASHNLLFLPGVPVDVNHPDSSLVASEKDVFCILLFIL